MPSPEEAHAYTKRMPVIGICLAIATAATYNGILLLIARLAGARLYYDYEVIEDASLASEDWERDLAYEDNPAEDKKLICAEIVRLEQLWKAKPPV
jgi:hypothetical protein